MLLVPDTRAHNVFSTTNSTNAGREQHLKPLDHVSPQQTSARLGRNNKARKEINAAAIATTRHHVNKVPSLNTTEYVSPS